MKYKKLYLALLGIGLSNTHVYAAEAVPLDKENYQSVNQLLNSQPATHTTIRSSSQPKQDNESFEVVRERTDKNQAQHTRIQQMYNGYPVIGGYAVVHKPSQKNIRANGEAFVSGKYFKSLEKDLGAPPPMLEKNASKALESFLAPYGNANLTISQKKSTPVIFIDNQNKAHWAYRVSAFIAHKHKIPERPSAIIDAKTFKPFVKWNDVKSASVSVKGQGFGGNERISQQQYGVDLPYLNIQRDPRLGTCYMQNHRVKVVDMMHRYELITRPMRFSCRQEVDPGSNIYWTGYSANGLDEQNGAFSPSNDALHSGEIIKNMYTEWYDVEVLQKNNRPMQLVMRVHFGSNYENAFWDGDQMTFGDGFNDFYPLVSLGIGAHEVSHGFTEQHSGLEYYGQSGGMNEAFSDMAAQAAEFYASGKNDWRIGAEIVKEGSGLEALRFMDRPSRDGESIDSANDYSDNLDVHHTSGVYNRLFYTLATTPGWTPKEAFHVMVKANMDYWTPNTSFQEGGCGIIYAAHELGYSTDSVRDALRVVNIDDSICKQ